MSVLTVIQIQKNKKTELSRFLTFSSPTHPSENQKVLISNELTFTLAAPNRFVYPVHPQYTFSFNMGLVLTPPQWCQDPCDQKQGK